MPRMGDLAATDVYNAFDVPLEQTYDRRLDQTWPGRLAQEAMGAVLAPGRALQSTEPITTEQMIKPAADLAGLVTGGSYVAPAQRGASGAGIRAYHSSPHDFDKFDLSKIGTGEGAQVYGHGLYFAESPAVSGQGGQYWQQFLPRFEGAEGGAAGRLKNAGFDREKALAAINSELEVAQRRLLDPSRVKDADYYRDVLEHQTRQRDLLLSGKPVGPRTYEVEIKADPAHMLDWDKALREQPKVIEKLVGGSKHPEDWVPNPDVTGARYWGTTQGAPHHRSDFMRERGIPGIKYLDQGSRVTDASRKVIEETYELLKNTSQGPEWAKKLAEINALPPPSSNYVVFDPGIIDIMKKYGIAGAAPVGMGALAAQDRYE